jgi:hypothetical protein
MLENTPLEKGKKNLPMLFGEKFQKGKRKRRKILMKTESIRVK